MAKWAHNKRAKCPARLQRVFDDEDAAHLFLIDLRWKGCPVCLHCDSPYVVYNPKRKMFWCSHCRKEYSVRKDTPFDSSKLELRVWLKGIFYILASKNTITSKTLASYLEITQKTAWFLMHRLRTSMQEFRRFLDIMRGIIEADEAYIGGKNKNKHSDKKLRGDAIYKAKIKVVGLREKSTKEVRCFIVDEIRKENINDIINKNVEKGSIICTDESNVYNDIEKDYIRMKVNHSKGIYTTEDGFTTNGIESFWSRLKRGCRTWVKISKKHVRKYLDEYEFRAHLDGLPKITKGVPTYLFEMLKACFATPPIRYKTLIAKLE